MSDTKQESLANINYV